MDDQHRDAPADGVTLGLPVLVMGTMLAAAVLWSLG